MTEIICECGHWMIDHYCDGAGCAWVPCSCDLTPGIIEARYWARKMKEQRDILRKLIDAQAKEINTLHKALLMLRDKDIEDVDIFINAVLDRLELQNG